MAKHRVSALVFFYSLSNRTDSVGYPDLVCCTDVRLYVSLRIGIHRGPGAVAAQGDESGGLMRSVAPNRWLAS